MLKLSQTVNTDEDDDEDEIPSCFGKKFDATAVECIGGDDPAYSAKTGELKRPKCDMLSACAVRTQAMSRGTGNNVVPVQNVVRPSTTFTPPSVAAQPYRPSYMPPQPQPQQYHPQQYQQVGLQQAVPVNYGMPQYLTNREPAQGRGLMARLGIEVLRSLGKSAGHTLAHFFDVEAFGRRD